MVADGFSLLAVTGDGLAALAMPSLTHVNFSRCDSITDAGVLALCSGLSLATHLEAKRNCLLLRACQSAQTSSNATSASAMPLRRTHCAPSETVARSCRPSVHVILLPQPRTVTSQTCWLSVLCGNVSVTDALLGTLAAGCANLRKINLWKCSQLTDAGVSAAAETWTQLRELCLADCPMVGSASLSALAKVRHGLCGSCSVRAMRLIPCSVRSCGLSPWGDGTESLQRVGDFAWFRVMPLYAIHVLVKVLLI